MDEDASVSLDGKSLTNLRVIDLKQELEKRGLSKSGSKKDLVKRLKQQIEFEKLCDEKRKSTGDCDLKLELDAVTEQNEFVQQYLAQQQKIYAEQKEVKRLVELEEIQKSGDEKESCDSKCDTDALEQEERSVSSSEAEEPNQSECNKKCDSSSEANAEPSSSEAICIESSDDFIHTEVLQEKSLSSPGNSVEDSRPQGIISGMERRKKRSPVSNVPYSLSDIQLPDSPGCLDVKSISKPKASDFKKKKDNFGVMNQKISSSDDHEIPSNGVSSVQCLDLKKDKDKEQSKHRIKEDKEQSKHKNKEDKEQLRIKIKEGEESQLNEESKEGSINSENLERHKNSRTEEKRKSVRNENLREESPSKELKESLHKKIKENLDIKPKENLNKNPKENLHKEPKENINIDPVESLNKERKENILQPDEGDSQKTVQIKNSVKEKVIDTHEDSSSAVSEENSDLIKEEEVKEDVKSLEVKSKRDISDSTPSESETAKISDSVDQTVSSQSSRSHLIRKRNKSESSDSTSRSSESSSERDVYGKHGEDLKSHPTSVEVKETPALTFDIPEKKESEEEKSPLPKSAPSRRLKIKRNTFIHVESKKIEAEIVDESVKQDNESMTTLVEVPEVQQEDLIEVIQKPVVAEIEKLQPKITNTRKLSISNRKLNRKSTDDNKSEETGIKKSRWGNYASSLPKSSISISTDSLKNLIPDFKLITGPISANDAEDLFSPVLPGEPSSSLKETRVTNLTFEKEVISEEMRDETSVTVSKQLPPISECEAEQPLEKCSSPQGPVSRIIFIKNLVRPFTLMQLKELLKTTGTMVEEHFWIDKIKSKCIVEYETEEEAVNTRLALNGTRWPSSNPKILSAEFATQEELDLHRNIGEIPHSLPPQPIPTITDMHESRTVLSIEDHKKKERDRRKEKSKPRPPLREWDKDKLTQDSPERGNENKDGEKVKSAEKKEKKDSKRRTNEDTPAKLLDDLFQKTKSSPCIYWLPLTDEQIKQREEDKRLRVIAREKRNQQREQEEASRRNRTRPVQKGHEKESKRSQSRSRSPIARRR